MVTSARFKFTVTLVVSVLGFVLTLYAPEFSLMDEQLTVQTPRR